MKISSHIRSGQILITCPDLGATLRFFTEELGFRLETILPADSPALAVICGHGLTLRLEAGAPGDAGKPAHLRLLCAEAVLPGGAKRRLTAPGGTIVELVEAEPALELPEFRQEFLIARLAGDKGWGVGRAGMEYRDLIPGRLGGRFIASHIRIPAGGSVPDYVHFHKLRFQMIYCRAGWTRLVYEDQGEPFLLQAGDCVLQPPEIRHRVLEASPGLEVIEIGSPALHATCVDHELALPTPQLRPERRFAGQRFHRHIAASAKWRQAGIAGFEARDTGIGEATGGLAGARVLRAAEGPTNAEEGIGPAQAHAGELLFLFVLQGELDLQCTGKDRHGLLSGDACVLPAGLPHRLGARAGLELLEVSLPARLPRAKVAS